MAIKHYEHLKIDVAEFCSINDIPFLEGNIIKYVCRWKQKNGIEDLQKAKHYIEMLIKFNCDYENQSVNQSRTTNREVRNQISGIKTGMDAGVQ